MNLSKRILSQLLIFNGLIFTLSCSNNDIKINTSEENLCAQVAAVACRNIFTCCTGQDIEDILGEEFTQTEEQCRRDVGLACENKNAELLYAFAQGTATINKPDLDACLQAMLVTEGACSPYTSMTDLAPSCRERLVQGQVGESGDCLFDFECHVDAYCAPNRRCISRAALNESCELGQICATDLYCAYDAEAEERRCKSKVAVNGGCADGLPCEDALYCFPLDAEEIVPSTDPDQPTITGTCKAPLALGATCKGDEECASDKCLPGVCAIHTPTGPAADGCMTDDQCLGECSVSKEPCMTDDNCNVGADGTCNGGPRDGDSCDARGDCTPGTCNGGPLAGEQCFDDDNCTTDGNVCVGGNADGDYCVNDGWCASVCSLAEYVGDDVECNSDADCMQKYCDGDVGPTTACTTTGECNSGQNEQCTADVCYGGASSCQPAGSGTCDFPAEITCAIPSAQTCDGKLCQGEHTCVAQYQTIDYCDINFPAFVRGNTL